MPTTTEIQDAWAQYFPQQPVDTSFEEKLNRIAQIEEDWLKIEDKCSDSNSPGSTPENCDEFQDGSKPEQDKFRTNDSFMDDQSNEEDFTPRSCTAINQALIRHDESPLTPNKRTLDKDGNLTPLPSATPPPGTSDTYEMPSVSTQKSVVLPIRAVSSPSEATISSTAPRDNRLLATFSSQQMEGTPMRPYRVSKLLKAAGVANVPVDIKDREEDVLMPESRIYSPSKHDRQDPKGEHPSSGNILEFGVNAILGKYTGSELPVHEVEDWVPKTDDLAKGHGGFASDKGPDVEVGNKETQRLSNVTIEEEGKPYNEAVNDLPKTDDIAKVPTKIASDKGLDTEVGDKEAQPPSNDSIEKEEKPYDEAANEIPKTNEIAKVHGGIASDNGLRSEDWNLEAVHPSEDTVDEREKPGDKAGNAELETDGTGNESGDIESDDNGPDLVTGSTNAQHPGEDGTDEGMKPGHGLESDVPKTGGIAEGHDETKGVDDLHVENVEAELHQRAKVDIADEVKPVRRFTCRGLALYMEARGFGEGRKNHEGHNAVERPLRKDETLTEWGLALLLEAMDGSIGI